MIQGATADNYRPETEVGISCSNNKEIFLMWEDTKSINVEGSEDCKQGKALEAKNKIIKEQKVCCNLIGRKLKLKYA